MNYRTIIFILVTFVLLFALTLQKREGCSHNQQIKKPRIATADPNEHNSGRILQEARQPIRVTFDFTQLESLENEQIKQFLKTQLNLSAKFFSELLSVNRIIGNNVFRAPNAEDQNCFEFNVSERDRTEGIPDSDLHIYADFISANSGLLAFAGPCLLSQHYARPIFGHATFNINHIDLELTDSSQFEDYFETITHEITHILGFSLSSYSQFLNPATGKAYGNDWPFIQKIEEGRVTNWITSPKVKQLAREYYNCPTLIGMRLENEGLTGSAGSHWERVVLENEFMNASSVSHDAAVSPFTLALLEDSGWYTANYEKADKIDWGRGRGCDFFDTCEPDSYREFSSSPDSCGFYHNGIAQLGSLGFGDQCVWPLPQENRLCGIKENLLPSDRDLGNVFREDSRCFESNVQRSSSNTNNEPNQRCFPFVCNENGTVISVTVGGETYEIDRETNSVQITKRGRNQEFEGYVRGPAEWEAFCLRYPSPCPEHCSSNGFCLGGKCYCDDNHAGKDCATECANGNYIQNGQCLNSQLCPEGFLVEENIKECFPDTRLTNCPQGQFLFNGQCLEACPERTYVVQTEKTAKCLPCSIGCERCTEERFCSSCREFTYQFFFNDEQKLECLHQCPIGYRQNEQGVCQESCSIGCEECTDYYHCSKCESRNYLGEDLFCHPCNYFCENCDEAKFCGTCKQNWIDQFVNPGLLYCTQKCYGNKYLDAKTNQCLYCDSYCKGCLDYESCIDCNPERYKFYTEEGVLKCLETCPVGMVSIKDKLCVPHCPVSTYFDPKTKQCESCPNGCKKCYDSKLWEECANGFQPINSNSSEICITCQFPCLQCNEEGECLSCENGYFLNSSLKQCQPCSENCERCDNAKHCTLCKHGYLYDIYYQRGYVQACTQSCEDNEYIFNLKCYQCQEGCAKCSSRNECDLCEEGYYMAKKYNGDLYCVSECPYSTVLNEETNSCDRQCRENQYLTNKGGSCSTCNKGCATCSSFYYCDTCLETLYRYYNYQGNIQCIESCPTEAPADEESKSCQGTCPIYTYLNNGLCEQCHISCVTCYGKDNSSCITCNEGFFLTKRDECEICHHGCATCNKDQCLTCLPGYLQYIDEEGVLFCMAECRNGFYLNSQGSCSTCPKYCANCTEENKCLTCKEGVNKFTDDNGNAQCLLKCPEGLKPQGDGICSPDCGDGQFYDIVDQVCKACSQGCSNCNNQNDCVSCESNKFELGRGGDLVYCISYCPSGTFVEGRKCENCQQNCSECNDSQNCQVCNGSHFLDEESRQCLRCSANCIECVNANTCQKCRNGKLQQFETEGSVTCVNACTSGFTLVNNSKCYPNCPSGLFHDEQGDCIDTSCSETQFYNKQTKRCEQCNSNCKTCSQQDQCTSCNTGLFLKHWHSGVQNCQESCGNYDLLWETDCFPKCEQGYEHGPDGDCVKIQCTQTCDNCDSSLFCNKCQPGKLLWVETTFRICVDSCREGSYQSGDQCLRCPQLGCNKCTADTCMACNKNYYYEFVNQDNVLSCVYICPQGYHPSSDGERNCEQDPVKECAPHQFLNNNNECDTCKNNCKTCTDLNTCTSCQNGFYLTQQSSCLACSPSCLTCIGKSNQCDSCRNGQYVKHWQSGVRNCQPSCGNRYRIVDGTRCYQNCNSGQVNDENGICVPK